MGKRRLGRQRIYSLNKLGKTATSQPAPGASNIVADSTVIRNGYEILTQIAVTLTSSAGAAKSGGTDKYVIGVSSSSGTHSPAYLSQLTVADNGYIVAADMTCVEVPTAGTTMINLVYSQDADRKYGQTFDGGAGGAVIVTGSAAWSTIGDFRRWSTGNAQTQGALAVSGNVPGETYYLYLAQGSSATTALYTAGKYVIRLYGIAVPDSK